VFAAFSEGHGKISREELTHLLCGEQCAVADTVPSALREFDLDHDDGISFEEFVGLLRQSRADRLDLFDARRVARGV
jgi:Ca2+-binding EF-hand superfamily protein